MYSSIIKELPDNPVQRGEDWFTLDSCRREKKRWIPVRPGVYAGRLITIIPGCPPSLSPVTWHLIPALELAGWIHSDIPLRRSVGCAAINALIPRTLPDG